MDSVQMEGDIYETSFTHKLNIKSFQGGIDR